MPYPCAKQSDENVSRHSGFQWFRNLSGDEISYDSWNYWNWTFYGPETN